ncbi:MAG TPA: CoA-binding protein [Anaeromyxobacteraceae bacterium]|nr:CoA-binding protein [Anaeromyxobacteraceae bacterium]
MRPGVEEILAERRIAVVGVSRGKGFGNLALETLRERGWEAVPVNARADVVEGEKCFHGLSEIPGRPGAVLAVVPPAETEKVVDECLRLGVRKIWMQQGAESEAAIARAEKGGMTVVHHACVLMYAQPRGFHRFHGWVTKLMGKH